MFSCSISDFASFPFKVPRAFAQRIQPHNSRDPLLLQVLPQSQELIATEGYSIDPLRECEEHSPLPGVLHKYRGRVLLLITADCPINCRFCFRRHPETRQHIPAVAWPRVLEYLESDASINEVILSGGEPLVWQDEELVRLLQRLAAIRHITRLRIHSRMPLLVPTRITAALSAALHALPLPLVVVLHCNHAQEIDDEVVCALARLRCASSGSGGSAGAGNNSNSDSNIVTSNITLLSQTVLLKGINNDAATLAALSEKLFAAGVLPYYLHLLDKVQGAAHFAVGEEEAKNLMMQLRQRLSGYLVPRLMRDGGDGALTKEQLG